METRYIASLQIVVVGCCGCELWWVFYIEKGEKGRKNRKGLWFLMKENHVENHRKPWRSVIMGLGE